MPLLLDNICIESVIPALRPSCLRVCGVVCSLDPGEVAVLRTVAPYCGGMSSCLVSGAVMVERRARGERGKSAEGEGKSLPILISLWKPLSGSDRSGSDFFFSLSLLLMSAQPSIHPSFSPSPSPLLPHTQHEWIGCWPGRLRHPPVCHSLTGWRLLLLVCVTVCVANHCTPHLGQRWCYRTAVPRSAPPAL